MLLRLRCCCRTLGDQHDIKLVASIVTSTLPFTVVQLQHCNTRPTLIHLMAAGRWSYTQSCFTTPIIFYFISRRLLDFLCAVVCVVALNMLPISCADLMMNCKKITFLASISTSKPILRRLRILMCTVQRFIY